MITEFKGKSHMENMRQLESYLYGICEQLNISFAYLEEKINTLSKAVSDKNPVFDSVTLTGDKAKLDSDGLLVCSEVKSNYGEFYESAEIENLTVSGNGTQINGDGIKYNLLWAASGAENYKTTGDTLTAQNIDRFRLYLVRLCTENGQSEGTTYILCNRLGQYIRGAAAYVTDTAIYQIGCNLTVSDSTVTVTAVKAYYPLNGNFTDRKISRIYGLM